MREGLSGGIVAFLVVLISRSLLPAEAPALAPSRALEVSDPSGQVAPGACGDARPRGLERLTPEALRISDEITSLQTLRTELAGEPLAWPEDADPVEMLRLLEDLGEEPVVEDMHLESVDCSEYPCIGVYGIWTPDVPSGTTRAYASDTVRELRQRSEYEAWLWGGLTWKIGDMHFMAVVPYTSMPTPEDRLRVDMRLRAHQQRLGLE